MTSPVVATSIGLVNLSVMNEVRGVTIETTGNQGDGIANIERSYVVIVIGRQPSDELTVEIEQVKREGRVR